jgi:hypothetical protein
MAAGPVDPCASSVVGATCFISGRLPPTVVAHDGAEPDTPPVRFPGMAACEPVAVVKKDKSGKGPVFAMQGTQEWRIMLSGDWAGRVHGSRKGCTESTARRTPMFVQSVDLVGSSGTETVVFRVREPEGNDTAASRRGEGTQPWPTVTENIWPSVGANVYVARSLVQKPRVSDKMKIGGTYGTEPTRPAPEGSPNEPPLSRQTPRSTNRDVGKRSASCAPMTIVDMLGNSLVVKEVEPQLGEDFAYEYAVGADWKDISFRTQEECVDRRKQLQVKQGEQEPVPVP